MKLLRETRSDTIQLKIATTVKNKRRRKLAKKKETKGARLHL